jgi:hypothetical protein
VETAADGDMAVEDVAGPVVSPSLVVDDEVATVVGDGVVDGSCVVVNVGDDVEVLEELAQTRVDTHMFCVSFLAQ